MLALIDAELGDKEKAIQEGRTACDMLPLAKDAIVGVLLITNLARIYALTGEKDLALKQLDIVSKLPSGPSYGELRLDPEWDSLRGDPRFEKIVASLAPKEICSGRRARLQPTQKAAVRPPLHLPSSRRAVSECSRRRSLPKTIFVTEGNGTKQRLSFHW